MRGIHRWRKNHPWRDVIKPGSFYAISISLHCHCTLSVTICTQWASVQWSIKIYLIHWFLQFHKIGFVSINAPKIDQLIFFITLIVQFSCHRKYERAVLRPQSQTRCGEGTMVDFPILISISLYGIVHGFRNYSCLYWETKHASAPSMLAFFILV